MRRGTSGTRGTRGTILAIGAAAALGATLGACGSSGNGGTPGATGDGGPGSGADGSTGPAGGNDGSAPDDAAVDVISIPPPINDADAPSSDAGPGGPWVAYVSYELRHPGQGFDIYLVHPDGTDPHPIVQGPGNNLFPSWSPDGAKIAFASDRGSDAGGDQIYVVDVASGVVSPLATGLPDAVSPAWSPSGATIALGGPGGLYVVPSAGGTATPLTTGTFRDNSPAWAPDGSLVYFSSNRGDAGTFDVWSIKPDGSALQQVTTGTGILGGPAISPDGATIALTEGNGSTSIVFFSVATKTTTVFSAMGDSEPSFSPSGKQLAVTSVRYANNNPEVVLLGVPGAASPFRLTTSPGVDGQATFQPGH